MPHAKRNVEGALRPPGAARAPAPVQRLFFGRFIYRENWGEGGLGSHRSNRYLTRASLALSLPPSPSPSLPPPPPLPLSLSPALSPSPSPFSGKSPIPTYAERWRPHTLPPPLLLSLPSSPSPLSSPLSSPLPSPFPKGKGGRVKGGARKGREGKGKEGEGREGEAGRALSHGTRVLRHRSLTRSSPHPPFDPFPHLFLLSFSLSFLSSLCVGVSTLHCRWSFRGGATSRRAIHRKCRWTSSS